MPSARIEPELELCGYLVNKKGEKEFSYRSSLHQFLFEPTQKQSMSEEEEEILELNAEGEFIVPTSKAPKNFDAVNVPVAKAPAAAEKKKKVVYIYIYQIHTIYDGYIYIYVRHYLYI